MRWHIAVLVLVALLLTPLAVASGEPDKRWPQVGYNAQHNYPWPVTNTINKPSVVWSLKINLSSTSDMIGPVLSSDGTVYVLIRQYQTGPYKMILYPVSPDGRTKWNVTLPLESVCPHMGPFVSPSGDIYVVGGEDYSSSAAATVYVISPDGAVKNRIILPHGYLPSGYTYGYIEGVTYIDPADVPDAPEVGDAFLAKTHDIVYYGDPMFYFIKPSTGQVTFLNFTGPYFNYFRDLDQNYFFTDAVDRRGVVYSIRYFYDGTWWYSGVIRTDLKSMSVSYTLLKRLTSGSYPSSSYGSVLVGPDGAVYVSSYWGSPTDATDIFVLNPDMSIRWSKTLPHSAFVAGVTASRIYAIYSHGLFGAINTIFLLAYTTKGEFLWNLTLPINYHPFQSQSYDYEGNVYIGGWYCDPSNTWYGRLVSASPDGTLRWTFYFPAYVLPTSTPAPGGSLYVATVDYTSRTPILYKLNGFDPPPPPEQPKTKISVALAPDYSLWVLLLISLCVMGFTFASRGKIVLGISFIASAVAVYYVILKPFVSFQTLIVQAQQLLSSTFAQIPLGPILPTIVAITGIAVLLKALRR